MQFTATQAIKKHIALMVLEHDSEDFSFDGELTPENIDEVYDQMGDKDLPNDYESEFRCGEVETKIECDWSRHYESKSVARQLSTGEWVGWTYWYGGGKHGEPEAIGWMEDAYFLDVTETQQMVTVREFTKIEEPK